MKTKNRYWSNNFDLCYTTKKNPFHWPKKKVETHSDPHLANIHNAPDPEERKKQRANHLTIIRCKLFKRGPLRISLNLANVYRKS